METSHEHGETTDYAEPLHNEVSGQSDNLMGELSDKESGIELGRELMTRGDYAEAEKVLLRALGFDFNDPETNNYLGMVYFGLRKYDLARIRYKIALMNKPDYADAHFNLGDLYYYAYGDLS